ncbi:primosomal protein N' [Victivallis sp. Marseille-Q1083]|uniref:replication restart helicase PriA n=1 Tax=Victivallis sp. Marseille-Q1083 TaxID=2717288 RepID=UPI001588EE28|nr:primosomal protein N' [Victivallis sp. Marseille-Q1083]
MSRIARVIVDLSLDKAFDYLIPPPLAARIVIGVRVRVPFGNSFRLGYVLALSDHSDFEEQLKTIESLGDGRTQLPEALIKLGSWMAEYYCCTQEQAIRSLLPGAVRLGRIKPKTLTVYRVAEPEKARQYIEANAGREKAQGRVNLLKVLLEQPGLAADVLLNLAETTVSPLQGLVKNGLVAKSEQLLRRNPFSDSTVLPSAPLPANAEQQAALERVRAMLEGREKRHVMLLHGVTNSGKTEVYLQSIAMALELNRSAIVLVPEISLTPQTVRRFRARFGDKISVLHSRLSDGERFDEWNRINDGIVQIVVGARSALFAPFRNLGLIIVDEEHEASYKQSEAPRYHARDVAVMRGLLEQAAVILGSATPSFESYRNALEKRYVLVEMLHRVDDKLLPSVKVVDLRLGAPEPGEKKSGLFTKILIQAIQERLQLGEQTILFLNRRGFARQMLCESCGYVAGCPSCSVPYTYHRKEEMLSCHLCGSMIEAPECCPSCGAAEIRYSGSGTEKIESLAAAIFRGAKVVRMDSDSIRAGNSHEAILDRFRKGEIDILIGTQMIAKGLHFPNVTLVGIINADQGLYLPDFRACERTFQLLTQVAGRAGRGDVRGEVIIQTFSPANDTIRFAVSQDFKAFYQYDMTVREALHYPPDGHLMVLNFRSLDAEAGMQYAARCMELLRPFCHDEIIVSEPAPAPIEKIKTKYRFQIIFRGRKLKQLRQALRELTLRRRHPDGIELYLDIDAQSLL